MKSKKLISTDDLNLELDKNNLLTNKEKFIKSMKNTLFNKTPINLGMFIPCDLEGNVLEKPKQYEGCLEWAVGKDLEEALEYMKAESRVIFKGFEHKDTNKYNIWIINNKIKLDLLFNLNGTAFKDCLQTIQDLIGLDIELKQ